MSDWSGVGFGPASGNAGIIPYFSLTLSQSFRPRRRARRSPVKGTRCPSRGLRPGAAYRQRGGRRRHFRDYCQRPRKKKTHCCRDARPSSAAALPELRGGVRGVHHSPSSWRASSPPRSASLSTLSLRPLTRGSERTTSSHALRSAPLCSRGPPATQPKCAIGRARRRRLLPPPRSHGDPRQPMQWTLGPCGTPGAATAPAPLHYKYFSKMRRSSLRAPRPPAASALRP